MSDRIELRWISVGCCCRGRLGAQSGSTPLHRTIRAGHSELASMLLKLEADAYLALSVRRLPSLGPPRKPGRSVGRSRPPPTTCWRYVSGVPLHQFEKSAARWWRYCSWGLYSACFASAALAHEQYAMSL